MNHQTEMIVGVALMGAGFFVLSKFAGFDLFQNKAFWMVAGIVLLSKGWSMLSGSKRKCR